MYNSRVKNRKLKNILKKIFSLTKFKLQNFPKSKQLALVGIILGFLSMFVNWIESNNMIANGAFNQITGINSIAISVILIFLLFIIFSNNNKEKIKLVTNTSFKDNIMLLNLGILMLILSISSLYTITGLKTFFSDIQYGNGVIFSIISSIIIIISGIILKKDYQNNQNIFLNDSEKDLEEYDKKNNMKLPF